MIKRRRKNKLNGSVLYTVVAVMMIMTVFIFAALTLASSANRRAFNSYANNQTQYTARSVVDSMMKILEQNGAAAVGTVDKDLLNASLDSSMGEVTSAEIKSLGTIKDLEDAGYNFGLNLSEKQKNEFIVYKLSATVKMLGQDNTVSLYCYNGEEDKPGIFKNSLTSLGGFNSTANSIAFGGDIYSNIAGLTSEDVSINAPSSMKGAYGTQGDLSTYADFELKIDDFNKGVYIGGNLKPVEGSALEISFTKDITEEILYRQLPYTFISNTFQINYSNMKKSIGDNNHPFIVMADAIDAHGGTWDSYSSNFNIYGDIYLYSENVKESFISLNSTSGIYQFNSGKVKKKTAEGFSYTGGNIYSLGTINFGGMNGTLFGNVVADTVSFHNTGTDNKANGAVVARKIDMTEPNNGGSGWTFNGGLFTDPDNFEIAFQSSGWSPKIINGVQYIGDTTKEIEQTMLSGDKEISNNSINEMVPLIYSGENYVENGGIELIIPYDFSDEFSEDGFISIDPYRSTNKVTIKEIKIDISTFEDQNYIYSGCKIGCEIDPLNGDQTQKFDINYDFSNGAIIIPNCDLYSIKGEIRLRFYPDDRSHAYPYEWENPYEPTDDEGKYIYINSVNATLNVDVKRVGTVPVSAMDKLQLIKGVNDDVFNLNGNIIYIDDIDKSVEIKKYIDVDGSVKLSISKADLTTVDEGNESSTEYSLIGYTENGIEFNGVFDYNTQYAEFLRAVVETISFPESMTKDKVLDDGGGFVNTEFMSSEYLKEITNYSWGYDDVKDKLKDVNTYTALGSSYCSKIDKNGNLEMEEWSVKQLEYGEDNPIRESCIITGQLNGGTICIDPGENDLYIGLYDFNLVNGDIIVEDGPNKGNVYFYVPRDHIPYKKQSGIIVVDAETSAVFGSQAEDPVTHNKYLADLWIKGGKILTRTYYNQWATGELNVYSKNPPVDDTTNYAPNIYLYMDNNPGEDMALSISDGGFISGYICAPTARAFLHGAEGVSIKYDGADPINNKISILGSAIFKNAHFTDGSAFMFVDESATPPYDSEDNKLGKFTKLYYQAY